MQKKQELLHFTFLNFIQLKKMTKGGGKDSQSGLM